MIDLRVPFVSCLCLIAALAPAQQKQSPSPSRDLIWSAGGSFSLGKAVPGVIEVRGADAFPIVKDGGGQKAFGAAGTAGRGRLVAFSHGSFMGKGETLKQKAALQLFANAVKWAGRSDRPNVGVHPSAISARAYLAQQQIPSSQVLPSQIAQAKPHVYCVISDSQALTAKDIETIQRYLNAGGGVVVATTPWAFAKRHTDFSQSPGNRLLSAAGLAFLPRGYCDNKAPVSVYRPVEALDREQQLWDASLTPPHSEHLAVKAAQRLAANPQTTNPVLIENLKQGITLSGDDLTAYLHSLLALNQAIGPITPNRKNPITPEKSPLVDTVIQIESQLNLSLPAGMMYPIPAATDYPGPVADSTPRVTKNLSLDCQYRGWASHRSPGGWNAKEIRSTGLYAPPSEVITVTAPEALAAQGYEVVIGFYGGQLKNRKQWHRYPRLQRSVPIRGTETRVSNALGGLVGIRIPHQARAGQQPFTIAGAVQAPLYIEGQTSADEWRSTIRHYAAPMAEIASDRIIITVPSADIRDIDDPAAVTQLWSEILEMSADLAGFDRSQYRAERLWFDRQPAAGLLHSGYPVCGFYGEHSRLAVDAEQLREKGFWGFFHEYGHNHQHALWNLPNTGETTCNLWSVYVYEELIGKPRTEAHRALNPLVRLQTRKRYFASDPIDFQKNWSVWTSLDTYLLVQEEFGWEPFKKVFAEYHTLPEAEWPKGQQAINDQWVIRLSKACGKNLAPYWRAWHLPLTEQVDEQLADLPVWHCKAIAM